MQAQNWTKKLKNYSQAQRQSIPCKDFVSEDLEELKTCTIKYECPHWNRRIIGKAHSWVAYVYTVVHLLQCPVSDFPRVSSDAVLSIPHKIHCALLYGVCCSVFVV